MPDLPTVRAAILGVLPHRAGCYPPGTTNPGYGSIRCVCEREKLADAILAKVAGVLLDALSAAGYVIVHPQDKESMRAAGFVPGLSVPPIDCTNTCMDAECNCSGEWRVMAWKWLAPELSEP